MRSVPHLYDKRLSIVIPNARSLPLSLIQQLESQAMEGDEIIVVQNRPRLGARHWVSIKSDVRSLPFQSNFVNRDTSRTKKVPVIILQSDEGSATARNLGWRTAKNNWIIFLDDDITVNNNFLSEVKRYLTRLSKAGVVTFRVIYNPTCKWSSLIKVTISLDRGPQIYRTGEMSLRLQDVWMYGAGAAMLVDRSALQITGGFKDHFGAGRRNGGTEDTEFLWHASHHTTVEYHGRITVLHEKISSFKNITRKMLEYGRAIGHLGGTAKSMDGYRYVYGYCSHIEANTRLNETLHLSARSFIKVRIAVAITILETLLVYVYSLIRSPRKGLLCDKCRGISS